MHTGVHFSADLKR